MTRLIRGVGINDAAYSVSNTISLGYSGDGKRLQKVVWECPFHKRWKNMLERCYSPDKYHTYVDSSVCEEWLTFSSFKFWMEQQPWEGNQLDKDIIVKGNKLYSPDRCRFVPGYINSLLLTSQAARGEHLIGVTKSSVYKGSTKYMAQCKVTDILSGQAGNKYLGTFTTEHEAHREWQITKVRDIQDKLNIYSKSNCFDTRVADGLVSRIWQINSDILNSKPTERL